MAMLARQVNLRQALLFIDQIKGMELSFQKGPMSQYPGLASVLALMLPHSMYSAIFILEPGD
jgi:hypothetical protein